MTMEDTATPIRTITLPEGITEAMIAGWKQLHGRVHWIRVDYNGTTRTAIVRRPDLKVISAASSLIHSDPIKAGLVLYDSCKLYVDPVIEASDELKLSVTKRIGELFQSFETELGEL